MTRKEIPRKGSRAITEKNPAKIMLIIIPLIAAMVVIISTVI